MISLIIDIIEDSERDFKNIIIKKIDVDIQEKKCRATKGEEKVCKLIKHKLNTEEKTQIINESKALDRMMNNPIEELEKLFRI